MRLDVLGKVIAVVLQSEGTYSFMHPRYSQSRYSRKVHQYRRALVDNYKGETFVETKLLVAAIIRVVLEIRRQRGEMECVAV